MTAPEATVDGRTAGAWEIASITPEPTDSERAAIIAAVEALGSEIWPDPRTATMPVPSPLWRYAGRPWRRRTKYGGWN